MARVLIWKKVTPGSEYDLSGTLNNQQQIECALSAGVYNTGNRLWLQGLMSAIDTGENQYDFWKEGLSDQQINGEYDYIILPMANIFNRIFKPFLVSMTERLYSIRIPVYVIACGVQADSFDELDHLVDDIGEVSKQFIHAVYKTGGEFALRGWFTKDFFDRLGFFDAVVTGCPSLYQMGRDVHVCNQKSDCIRPIFNGAMKPISRLLAAYPNSLFYDQDLFMRHLYQPGYAEQITGVRALFSFYSDYGPTAAQMLAKDRIRLIPKMCDWWNEIRSSDANFAFGSRIHGNIMPILAGVPAMVLAMDSRTREMAEFFDIPYTVVSDRNHAISEMEFEKTYLQMDYSTFNKSFHQKFDAYEQFLVQHGIVSAVNQCNGFLNHEKASETLPKAVNQQKYSLVAEEIERKRLLLQGMSALRTIKKVLG